MGNIKISGVSIFGGSSLPTCQMFLKAYGIRLWNPRPRSRHYNIPSQKWVILLLLPLLWGYKDSVAAEKLMQIGKIKLLEGEVYLYRNPKESYKKIDSAKRAKLKVPIALHRNKYWEVYEAKKGDQVYDGDLIATRKNARIRVVLAGKSIKVGADSYFSLHAPKTNEKGSIIDNFLYLVLGKMRASIHKRSITKNRNIRIRSRSATMGVRGTDIYMSYRNFMTSVSVIEGEVDLANVLGDKIKKVILIEGTTSNIGTPISDSKLKELEKSFSHDQIAALVAGTAPTEPKVIPSSLLKEIKQHSVKVIKEKDKRLDELEQKLILGEIDRLLEKKKGILKREENL